MVVLIYDKKLKKPLPFETKYNMRKHFYKYCAISFLLTTLWTMYGFFDFFLTKSFEYSLVYYFYSVVASIILGSILFLLHLFFYFIKKSKHILSSFFFIFSVIFNLYMALIWGVCIGLDLLPANIGFTFFVLGSLLISSFLAYDIYKIVFEQRAIKKLEKK